MLSLEFASRVIHRDTTIGDKEFRSRTRRLYDVSNILMALKQPLLVKVGKKMDH